MRESFYSPVELISSPTATSVIILFNVDSAYSVGITPTNLANWIVQLPGASQKQIRAWAADNGVIYTIDSAVSADIADPVNIEWLHGNIMAAGDDLYNFIQSTLSFSSAQMAAAFVAMQGYPL